MELFGTRSWLKITLLALVALAALNRQAAAQAFWGVVERVVALSGAPVAATHAVLSEHEVERIGALPPQEQAEALMDRAVNRYEGATEMIEQRVDGWVGEIELSKSLESSTYLAYGSADLRVRVASVEVSLAAYGYRKEPEAARALLEDVRNGEGDMVFNVWVLGLLANRGVEREAIVPQLAETATGDADERVRQWSIEALGKVGSDEVIPILTGRFFYEPELWLKERAACNLADSGLFTKEQRMRAVPELVRMADHPSLEPRAHGWAFQALREITGEAIADDATAWRNWASANGLL